MKGQECVARTKKSTGAEEVAAQIDKEMGADRAIPVKMDVT